MFSEAKRLGKTCITKISHPLWWFIVLWLAGLFTTAGIAYSIRLILKFIIN
jgi:hypothetical protein